MFDFTTKNLSERRDNLNRDDSAEVIHRDECIGSYKKVKNKGHPKVDLTASCAELATFTVPCTLEIFPIPSQRDTVFPENSGQDFPEIQEGNLLCFGKKYGYLEPILDFLLDIVQHISQTCFFSSLEECAVITSFNAHENLLIHILIYQQEVNID